MSEINLVIVDERPNVTIASSGMQGPAGPQNLFVGPTDPGMTKAGMWLQTFPNGDMTLWVEDGEGA